MKKSRLFIYGISLRIMGYILYGVGAIGAIGIVSAGHKVVRVGFSIELLYWGIALLLAIIICVGLIHLGQYLNLHGKKLIVKHKADIFSNVISNETVLYLRSFSDDYITSKTQTAYQVRGIDLPQMTTEEEILAEEFNRFGKFISAANPNTNIPNPGAIQISFEEKAWKEKIKSLMKTSEFVIIRIGQGEHLKWEIDQAIALVPPQRLLILIPMNEDVFREFQEKLKLDHNLALPNLDISVFYGNTTLSAILYFNKSMVPKISICQDAGYRSSASKPLKPILRYALKPIYNQLDILWNPPRLPAQKYVPVIFFSYLTGLCLVWSLPDLSFFFSVYAIYPLHIPLIIGIIGLYRSIRNLKRALKQKEIPKGDISNKVGKQWEIPKEIRPFYIRSHKAWASGELAFLGKDYISAANLSLNDFYDLFRPIEGNSMSIFFNDFSAPSLEEYLISINDLPDENQEPWFILTNLRLIQKNGIDKMFSQIWIKDIEQIQTSGYWVKKLTYHLKSGNKVVFEKVDVYASEDYIEQLLLHF
ncbi:hypothetical protein [uncultured Croceitalea sp.]|uniref:hypothetical protein n=1 Tax=uncultured Croceitalea sp. TaxID=1798908 RepID=UPI003305DCBB